MTFGVIIKIMPCAEGDTDRSDCQPEASSIARSRARGMIVFITPKVNRSLTLFIYVL